MRIRIFALAVLLAGCAATPQAPSTPGAQITGITYVVNSWGYPQERWSITAAGEATFESKAATSRFDAPMQSQSFTFSAADFAHIQAELAPTERFIADGLACEVQVTDAPYGSIQWQRADGSQQELRFYTACRPTSDLTLFFNHLNAADERIHALTNQPDHSGRPHR